MLVSNTAGAAPVAAATSPAPVAPRAIPREAIIGDDVPAVAAAPRGADVNDAADAADDNAGTMALMHASGKKSLPLV
jgi:hypothetical protein